VPATNPSSSLRAQIIILLVFSTLLVSIGVTADSEHVFSLSESVDPDFSLPVFYASSPSLSLEFLKCDPRIISL